MALVGVHLDGLGPVTVMRIKYAFIAGVALSFVHEWIFGAYAKRAAD